MKNSTTFSTALFTSILWFAFSALAQNVNIPDANFKAALVGNTSINTNADAEIQVSEAVAYNALIDVSNSNISDLTGIEVFVNIWKLICSYNQLTSIDLTANTALIELICDNNQISNMYISTNTSLTNLVCFSNQLTSLDISSNTALSNLDCSINQLTNLVVSNNSSLVNLYCHNNLITTLNTNSCFLLNEVDCSYNQITNLDISSNTSLVTLLCSHNQLTNLDLQANIDISVLGCNNNQLSILDVSLNSNLEELYCSDNLLVSLDVSMDSSLLLLTCSNNHLSNLNIQNGNNSNFFGFSALNNPNLTCIQVDDVTYSNTNWAASIDATASYSTFCAACIVNIPDANFKAALVGNTAINTNGNGEIECTEASAYNGAIYVNNMNIADLTGIEAFVNIYYLECDSNQLTNLDVSANSMLTTLYCDNNVLTNLNISGNNLLQNLYCRFNQLTAIDVSANTALVTFWCNNNQIIDLDVSAKPYLFSIHCNKNQLTNLDVYADTSLWDLISTDNQLSSIDLSTNLALQILYCDSNLLSNLDISANTTLHVVYCNNNFLTSVDVSNNLGLSFLICNNNQVTALNLSANQGLTKFDCSGNQLTILNLQNGNNSNLNAFDATNNNNLTCIQVDNPAYSDTASGWLKDATAIYSTNCPGSSSCPNMFLAFNAANTNITTAPATATFTNNTLNMSNYNFVWYFGDGTFEASNAATVAHTYLYNGVYTVSLVADSAGCKDTLTMMNYMTCNVTGGVSCNHTVSISPSGTIAACAGSIVPVMANTNLINPVYQWNRNGVIIPGQNDDHLYIDQAGNYTLTVFDASACPQTSLVCQVMYSQAAAALPVITATGAPAPCGNINMTLTASGGASSYLWSTGQTGNSINVTSGGTYSVTAQNPGCDAVSLPFNISGTAVPVPPVCMVTVNESDNKNIVIWEKPVTTAIDSFLILREDVNNQNVFTRIASQSYNLLSEFKDNSSDAKARNYKYKIAVVDTCGGISIPSTSHQSMHLKAAQGNSVLSKQLTWNIYQGQPQAYNYHLIYRENTPGILSLIDSVPASQTWYIDNSLTQLSDTSKGYMIAYRVTNPCESTGRLINSICKSNASKNMTVGIKNLEADALDFLIIPNPNNGKFSLYFNTQQALVKAEIKIYDMLGNEMYSNKIINTKSNEIELSSFANGVYLLVLTYGVKSFNKRLVVAK